MNGLAKEYGVTLGLYAENLSDLYDLVKKLEEAGNKNLVLDVTGKTAKETLANAVIVRRTALKDGDRSFGYPSIVNLNRFAKGDARLQTAYAAMFTEKYGSIIVMEHMTYAEALPLYGLRQNIFTDPQKPMKVESKIYPLNGADENSVCSLTVDFALTYFLVSGEMERSNCPVNLLISDASGMSVLTAWAAGKFSASTIKKFFDENDINNKIKSRTLIIPGKVAVMKGEIQEKLPGWRVVVGPTEAVMLPKFLKDKEYLAGADEAQAAPAPVVEAAPVEEDKPLNFEELQLKVPAIEVVDMGVSYKGHNPDAQTFVTIGERIHCISPAIRKAMDERDPGPILEAGRRADCRRRYLPGRQHRSCREGRPRAHDGQYSCCSRTSTMCLWRWTPPIRRPLKLVSRSITAPTGNPSSTPPMPAPGSRTSTWLPPTTPLSSLCAPPTALPRTTKSG